MSERFETIIIGGGLSGLAAGIELAKSGKECVIFERGEESGSKNVIGGVLYAAPLLKILPDFVKEAPWERYIKKRIFAFVSKEKSVFITFDSEKWGKEPYYNYSFTVLRAKFDKWLSEKYEELGGLLLSGAKVEDFIWEGTKIIGVRTLVGPNEEEVMGDNFIIAEGANPFLAFKADLADKRYAEDFVIAVKEVLKLSEEEINKRFNLKEREGVAIEIFGEFTEGILGSGFIYTNRDTLSIGAGAKIEELREKGLNPNDLLENMKNIPEIKKWIEGAEIMEYEAHLIPEYGIKRRSPLVRDNVAVIGDAAGFVNVSIFHEGTNLAVESGRLVAEAIKEGNLKNYEKKLKKSWIWKDLEKTKGFMDYLKRNKDIIYDLPFRFIEIVEEMFTIEPDKPKTIKRKKYWQILTREKGITSFLINSVKGLKMLFKYFV